MLKDEDLLDKIINAIRKEVETCDKLQGFQFCHSIGSGTGGGLTCKIYEIINDLYQKKTNINFQVFPSQSTAENDISYTLNIYNSMLSISKFIQHPSHLNFIIDNQAIYNICHNVLRQKQR